MEPFQGKKNAYDQRKCATISGGFHAIKLPYPHCFYIDSLDIGKNWTLIDSGSGWFESLTIGKNGIFGEIRDNLMFSPDSGTTWDLKPAENTIGAFI